MADANISAPCSAIVAYIPALHRGYVDFFKKYSGSILYILGANFIREVPRMERDIRALTPEEVKVLVAALGIFSAVTVLDEKNIKGLLADATPIVMPDEDVSHQFTETHLGGKVVNFIPVFLRWDRQISTKEFEVTPNRIISEDEFDREVIAQAFEEAKKSSDWWRQIGAVLIRDGKPILTSHNTPIPKDFTPNIFGDPRANFDAGEAQYKDLGKFIHAEAGLIAAAARRGIPTEGATLYISTFPCPACAKLVVAAGIKKVFYAKGYSMLDAEDILREFKVEIVMVK